jgi:hypothetical protein
MTCPKNVRLFSVAIRCFRQNSNAANVTHGRRKAGIMATGERIDETGTLIQAGEIMFFRRDHGGRYQLELHRLPVNLIQKRVRLVGTLIGPMLVHVEGVAAA